MLSTAITPTPSPPSSSPCFRRRCWRRSGSAWMFMSSRRWGSSPRWRRAPGWPSSWTRAGALPWSSLRRASARRSSSTGSSSWEHTLALAAGVAGAALLLDAARRRPGRHADAGAAFAAGLLMGAAIVLRPEAACFCAAVLLASRTLVHRPTWRSLAVAAAGVGVALLPLEVYTICSFRVVRARAHQRQCGTGRPVPGSRSGCELASDWLLPSGWTTAGPVRTSSFWSVAPAAVVGVAALATRDGSERAHRFWRALRSLRRSSSLLTAPNDGGGQWGPRYLLFAYVPLALLAADAVRGCPGCVGLVIVVLLASCGWVQRAAYRQLRGTKATYGRVVDFVARNTQARRVRW